ncbi:MAG: NTP transferase domain-containing protein [Candidatus Magasanikbacteria bacterium]|jgi:mannose-1-phosphate guanylyltransferase|nr:NTP transferase domain-containing protein [Candidatus Magasanikbacteria bacterium]MBT4220741.1 NTP transferase domain-containing protein [Candidatus Magasanikbacteria bacterium]MBT4350086.1 NTP transferase domain-containing protein [Candidatus Magasanikbacteria bacterium]MBT4541471.1 NTP transferase domain-containing protein [Candidatus Magasanikbacteria bacterium]MBT6252999.1 NTP transferase domain-containing protein [Candidatus Magasanikbacteria bacterium]
MHVVIFAGGAGTRLWPLSRRNSPKQFSIFKDGKSTLQMAIDRVRSFGFDHMYLSTNEAYIDLVRTQVPELPVDHIFSEPAKRDLGAAVGLTLSRMRARGVKGPIAMLWADHFMDYPDRFVDALTRAKSLIEEKSDRFIFLGETPRFANHNLGWIHVGDEIDAGLHAFSSWKYRPELGECKDMFASKEWLWNPGYFVFDIDFVLGLYELHMLEMYTALQNMVADDALLQKEYAQLPAMSFDNAIVEKIREDQAVVLKVDLGWSDPGTLYALKEALSSSVESNVTRGEVITLDTSDSLIYNEEEGIIVTTIGVQGLVVVNTKDAVLVCPKDRVPEIKTLLKEIEREGKKQYL